MYITIQKFVYNGQQSSDRSVRNLIRKSCHSTYLDHREKNECVSIRNISFIYKAQFDVDNVSNNDIINFECSKL